MPEPNSSPPEPRACIIGAGPAGIEVSRILTAARIRHDVIDENIRPGGNSERRPAWAAHTELEARSGSGLVTLRLESEVVDLTGDRVVTWVDRQTVHREQYDAVFLCTGAYDGSLPRRSIQPARVVTGGALDAILKAHAVVPRGPIVVAGAGPFVWIAAGDLAGAGASIRAVVDRMRFRDYIALAPFGVLFPRSIFAFIVSLVRLILRGSTVNFGTTADASGAGYVSIRGRRIAVDHLAATDFFVPQTQLARSAGCAQVYSSRGRYFHSATDRDGRSSVPGIFVCGEGQGIHGRDYAIVTGGLAARTFAAEHGRRVQGRRWLPLRRRLLRLYGASLEARMYRSDAVAPADALVCNCERVTLGQVEAAIDEGLTDLSSIRSVTRCGMGLCQGRYCEPILTRLLEAANHQPAEPFFQKGFVRPVSVRKLIDANL